jgi:hypothetical protein
MRRPSGLSRADRVATRAAADAIYAQAATLADRLDSERRGAGGLSGDRAALVRDLDVILRRASSLRSYLDALEEA